MLHCNEFVQPNRNPIEQDETVVILFHPHLFIVSFHNFVQKKFQMIRYVAAEVSDNCLSFKVLERSFYNKKVMVTDYVDRLQVMCQESENRNFVNSGQSLHHFVLHACCGIMVRC